MIKPSGNHVSVQGTAGLKEQLASIYNVKAGPLEPSEGDDRHMLFLRQLWKHELTVAFVARNYIFHALEHVSRACER